MAGRSEPVTCVWITWSRGPRITSFGAVVTISRVSVSNNLKHGFQNEVITNVSDPYQGHCRGAQHDPIGRPSTCLGNLAYDTMTYPMPLVIGRGAIFLPARHRTS